MGFLDLLKESLVGKEVNLPICSLPRRKPIDVLYTYYEGAPRSHSILFRRGKRPVFSLLLPRYGEDLAQICSIAESEAYREPGGDAVFGFWARLMIRIRVGTLVSCRELFGGPGRELKTSFGRIEVETRYRLAYAERGAQESILLVSSRQGRRPGRGTKIQFNWLKLSVDEFRTLATHLASFMKSREFIGALEREAAG